MSKTPLLIDKTQHNAVGTISYAGVLFPPICDAKVEMQPVYDVSDRNLTSVRVKVSVTGFVAPGMFVRTNGSPYNFASSNQIDYGSPTQTTAPRTTDLDVAYLRSQLTRPGGVLTITGRGFGDMVIHTFDNRPSEYTKNDYIEIKNGPKPRAFSYEPVSNVGGFFEWECEANIVPCLDEDAHNFSIVLNHNRYLSYTVSTRVVINKKMLVKRIVTGEIVFPVSSSSPLVEQEGRIRSDIYDAFPLYPQFQREVEYSLSNDGATYSFTITDTEVDSDNPYPVGFASIEANHTIQSSLKNGAFQIWDGELTFRAELYPGTPKSYGALYLLRLLNYHALYKYRVANDASLRIPYGVKVPARWYYSTDNSPIGAARDAYFRATWYEEAKPWVTKLQFEDSIFSRKMGGSFSYKIAVDLSWILQVTGMYVPLANWMYATGPAPPSPGDATPYAQGWADWAAQQKNQQTLYVMRTAVNPGRPKDVCAVKFESPENASDWHAPYTGFTEGLKVPTVLKPNQTPNSYTQREDSAYTSMSNDISVISNPQSVSYSFLEDSGPSQTSLADLPTGDALGSTAALSVSPSLIQAPAGSLSSGANPIQGATAENLRSQSYRYGRGSFRVAMQGSAERIGSPPVIPELVAYGRTEAGEPNTYIDSDIGVTVQNTQKVGNDIVSRKIIGSAYDLETGQTALIYRADWYKEYIIPFPPVDDTSVTNSGPTTTV